MRMRRPVRYTDVYPKKTIYRSLGTDSRTRAEELLPFVKAQVLAELDDRLNVVQHDGSDTGYSAAISLAARRGFMYQPQSRLLEQDIDAIAERVAALRPGDGPEVTKALLGGAAELSVRLSQLVEADEAISATENKFKSEKQMKLWRLPRIRAVANLTKALCEDREIMKIDAEDAMKHRNWWMLRIAAEGQSIDTANKEMNTMAGMLKRYYLSRNIANPPRPYIGVSLQDKHKKKNRKLEIPASWMESVWFKPGALDKMNPEARDILLISIETGCRQSEIHDLLPGAIILDADIPHLRLKNEMTEDGKGGREVKNIHSERLVPLLGVALAAAKRHPDGFTQYRGSRSYSGTVNKFLRENELMPSPKHTVGGTRHAFESRLKAAGIEPDLRGKLMGHSVEQVLGRPWYGDEMPLSEKVRLMRQVLLPVPAHFE